MVCSHLLTNIENTLNTPFSVLICIKIFLSSFWHPVHFAFCRNLRKTLLADVNMCKFKIDYSNHTVNPLSSMYEKTSILEHHELVEASQKVDKTCLRFSKVKLFKTNFQKLQQTTGTFTSLQFESFGEKLLHEQGSLIKN